MKKLETLGLLNLEKICAAEQRSIKGGGEWILGPDGKMYYFVGEVEVTGYVEPSNGWAANCERCQQNQEYGIGGDPIYRTENQSILDTFTELFSNTIPHWLGVGGHSNGQDTWKIFPNGESGPKTNPNEEQQF